MGELRRRKPAQSSSPEKVRNPVEERKSKVRKRDEMEDHRKRDEENLFYRVVQSLKHFFKEKLVDASKKPPFSISPCNYDATTYSHNNPFVEVTSKPGIEGTGKVDKIVHARDHPMDSATIQRICREFGYEVEKSRMACGFRDVHISYLRPLVMLADEPHLRIIEDCSAREKFKKKRKLSETQSELMTGFYMQIDSATTERSQLEGLQLMYEGDTGEKRKQTDVNRFDIELLVHDLGIHDTDDVVTVAYVECKRLDEDLPAAIYQAAAYAKPGAMRNMNKGRYSPIFLYGFSKTSWTYGMLVPYGKIRVENDAITEIDSVHEKDSKGYIEQTLRQATKDLKEKYAHQSYPDGAYLSGFLYVDKETRPLPQKGSRMSDCRLFFQSLLEIVVGRHVVGWTVEEVERRIQNAHDQLMTRAKSYG